MYPSHTPLHTPHTSSFLEQKLFPTNEGISQNYIPYPYTVIKIMKELVPKHTFNRESIIVTQELCPYQLCIYLQIIMKEKERLPCLVLVVLPPKA